MVGNRGLERVPYPPVRNVVFSVSGFGCTSRQLGVSSGGLLGAGDGDNWNNEFRAFGLGVHLLW